VNTAVESFNTIMGQMTETSQRKNRFAPQWKFRIWHKMGNS